MHQLKYNKTDHKTHFVSYCILICAFYWFLKNGTEEDAW